ncbi:MAG: pentapeptide repeat-containing protein [Oscillospiraceae bacterium]|nr:pentapeptide repeat-containing protein [Oscillospiraceae bacterium]
MCFPKPEFQKVKAGLTISQEIHWFLKNVDGQNYKFSDFEQSVKGFNDILQGRGEHIKAFIVRLKEKYGTLHVKKVDLIEKDISNFLMQKVLLDKVYDKSSSQKYDTEIYPHPDKPLKIITQKIYDSAVKGGFPNDFFKDSYFEGIKFYCLPDCADFSNSRLVECRFTVCRAVGANFNNATLDGAEFHTSNLQNADFSSAYIRYTQFRDCDISSASFHRSLLNECYIADCVLDKVNFFNIHFKESRVERITANDIKEFRTVQFSMNGATKEECRKNRESIYTAFGVPMPPPPIEKMDYLLTKKTNRAKAEILKFIADFRKQHGSKKAFDELCVHLKGYNKDSEDGYFDFAYDFTNKGHTVISTIHLENGKLRLSGECEIWNSEYLITDGHKRHADYTQNKLSGINKAWKNKPHTR